MTPPPALISLAFIAAISLSGCSWLADVSSTMRVDTGLEPENIDANVRFRTTYYFRVLTGCSIDTLDTKAHDLSSGFAKRTSGAFTPLNDSLYRFRMTGQAAALFNKVHFESGVLRKEQIDPFGSTLRYNEETHAFSVIAPDKTRDTATYEIEQFRKLYKDIQGDGILDASHKTKLLEQLITMIENRLEQLKTSPAQNTPPKAAADPSKAELAKLEQHLIDTKQKLQDATKQLTTAKKKLDEAGDKITAINQSLGDAKTKLTSPTPVAEEDKTKIDTLTNEYTAAQTALTAAKATYTAAEKLVADLTTDTTKTKDEIKRHHDELRKTKESAVTSLKDLAKKTEDLLVALGEKQAAPQPSDTPTCTANHAKNKYYLLGPEGAKELDPNDRLLLALSVDSKPLISALQQLSERKMHTAGTNIKTIENLLEERGRILDAQTLLHKATRDTSTDSDPTDHSKLETLLDALRQLYTSTSTPVK